MICAPPRYGHVNDVDAGRHLEELDGEMTDGRRAERSDVDLARIGLRVGDEFLEVLDRKLWAHVQDQRQLGQPRDQRDVAQEIERQRLQRHVDGVGRRGEEKRVAVGRRTDDGLGADIGAAAGPVVDDHRLAEPLGQPLSHQARNEVGGAAGRIGHDPAHRPRRVALRDGRARHDGEGGGDSREAQEFTAWKVHRVPLLSFRLARLRHCRA